MSTCTASNTRKYRFFEVMPSFVAAVYDADIEYTSTQYRVSLLLPLLLPPLLLLLILALTL